MEIAQLGKIFQIVVIFVIFQRIYELHLSKRNEKYLLSKGAKVIPEKNYFFIVCLHASWLVTLLYWSLTRNQTNLAMFTMGLILFLIGQFLRLSAIRTLGKRWSTRIIVLPNAPLISSGLFKFIRHPNYLGVALEIFALPLMGGSLSMAIVFSLINFVILFFRIRLEEEMLGISLVKSNQIG